MTFVEAVVLMKAGETLRHDFHGYTGLYRIRDTVLYRQNENLPAGNPYRDWMACTRTEDYWQHGEWERLSDDEGVR